jgi:valyl-tRNA synthetase
MRLYEEKIQGYRNFTNKLWNASRFVLGILEEKGIKEVPEINLKALSDADQWILSRMNEVIVNADKALTEFRISEAGQMLYDFLWNDFCDWYLELSKGEKQNPAVLYLVLKNILILLHPITPFVTEQIWSDLPGAKGMLIRSDFPAPIKGKFDGGGIALTTAIISSIRRLRGENKIEPAAKVAVTIYGGAEVERNQDDIIRLARISELTLKKKGEKLKGAAADIVEGVEIYIPLEGLVDTEKEKERLSKEIENLEKYIASVSGKLANKEFVKNAPKAVVEGETAKLEEAKSKAEKMREQLGNL